MPVDVKAVAWLPMPPVLVPAIGGPDEADAELAALRGAITAAVQTVLDAEPGQVVIVAPTPVPCEISGPARWSWHGFGLASPPDTGTTPVLPWQLGLGAWLLDEAGWLGGRRYVGVVGQGIDDGTTDVTVEVGGDGGAVGVLVLGDGSACRGERSPGGDDPRAAPWDARLAELVGAGDIAGLQQIDQETGRVLRAEAAVSWPAAAAGLAAAGLTPPTRARLTYDAAPWGVGYLVATWTW